MNNKFIYTAFIVAFYIYIKKQQENKNPKIFYRKKLFNNYNGYILPPFGIFIKESEKNNVALFEHEKIHWEQFSRMGILNFALSYFNQTVKNGYDKNIFEIEARKIEDEYCKLNYTECVRKGISKTVYNPNFRKHK
jgi:hypothetical protein